MRLVLATAHTDLRLSLELLLSEQPGVIIVGAVSEGDGLMALIGTTNPDMVMAEWDLPGRSLPTIISALEKSDPHPRIIILTGRNRDCQTAVAAGADAAVLKGASPDFLLTTFREVRSRPA